MSRASVKYGYSTPLGIYEVFFDQAFAFKNPVDGSIGRKTVS
jgi:hypothetical protein